MSEGRDALINYCQTRDLPLSYDWLSDRYRICLNKSKGSQILEHSVPELMLVLGSQPAGDVSHKPSGRLPLLSARPAVTLSTFTACCSTK